MKKIIISIFLMFALIGCSKEKAELPVEMTYRPAIGPGYVQSFQNKTNYPLRLNVTFLRGSGLFPTTIRSGELTLGPNEEREIGWMQGVTLQQGDRIIVTNPDYKDGSWMIPRRF